MALMDVTYTATKTVTIAVDSDPTEDEVWEILHLMERQSADLIEIMNMEARLG